MIKELKLSKRVFLSFTIHVSKSHIKDERNSFELYIFPTIKIKHSSNNIIEGYSFLGWTSFSLNWLYYEITLAIQNKN